jgi:hypothetical protein
MHIHLVHVCNKKYKKIDSSTNLKQDIEGKWGLNWIKTNGRIRGIYNICSDQLLWFLYECLFYAMQQLLVQNKAC